MYNDLMQLAQEKSSEKRLDLLRNLTDLFLNGPATGTTAESYLFNEIVAKIVGVVAREEKIQIAVNLATLPEFPRDAVRKLASDDDIDIARPVIRGAPALTDDDLIEIAQAASQAHLNAIASRTTLSENVTDVLIDRGDTKVVHTVSANHGARFSPHGMGQLVEKARDDVDLREALVERPDLSQEIVDGLLPLISEQLAVKLAERGYELKGALSPRMQEAVRRQFTAALRERRADIRKVVFYIEEVRAGSLTLDTAIQLLVSSERLVDVSTILGEFVQLDRAYLFALIGRGEVETIMILFRSLGLAWPTLAGVLELRAAKLGTSGTATADLERDYNATDPAIAQRLIRFLKLRKATAPQEAQSA